MANKPSIKVKHECFISKQTPESAYILGLIWADGHVCKRYNSVRLQCLKDDIDYFYPIFQTTGEYSLYYRKQPLNDKISGTINFSSRELHAFLSENDYITKSTSSHKKILSNISKHLWRDFILGLSDGDGCFYIHMGRKIFQWIITSSYEQDWGGIEEIMNELGVKYRISRVEREKGKYSQFQVNGPENVLKVGEFMYKGDLGLARKRDKFEQIKSYINGKSYEIICYDKQYNMLQKFNSLKEASNWVGKQRNVSNDIRDVCVGRQQTAFGYIWERISIE
jgi:hypothetical protein